MLKSVSKEKKTIYILLFAVWLLPLDYLEICCFFYSILFKFRRNSVILFLGISNLISSLGFLVSPRIFHHAHQHPRTSRYVGLLALKNIIPLKDLIFCTCNAAYDPTRFRPV